MAKRKREHEGKHDEILILHLPRESLTLDLATMQVKIGDKVLGIEESKALVDLTRMIWGSGRFHALLLSLSDRPDYTSVVMYFPIYLHYLVGKAVGKFITFLAHMSDGNSTSDGDSGANHEPALEDTWNNMNGSIIKQSCETKYFPDGTPHEGSWYIASVHGVVHMHVMHDGVEVKWHGSQALCPTFNKLTGWVYNMARGYAWNAVKTHQGITDDSIDIPSNASSETFHQLSQKPAPHLVTTAQLVASYPTWEFMRSTLSQHDIDALEEANMHARYAWGISRADGVRLEKQATILFHGPPGTGKTWRIKALLRYWHEMLEQEGKQLTIIKMPPSTEATILVENFKFASHTAPAVVIIEDVERIALFRNDKGVPLGLLTLLDILDGLTPFDGVVTVMTTNIASLIDEALLRPERLHLAVHCGYLSRETAYRVFQHWYESMGLAQEPISLPSPLPSLKGLSYAEIKGLVRTIATQYVIRNKREWSVEDINAEIKNIKARRSVSKMTPGIDKSVGFGQHDHLTER